MHIDIKVDKKAGLGFEFEFRDESGEGIEKAFLTSTTAGTEAAKKGLQPGMFIERINGMDMTMLSKSQIEDFLAFKDGGNKLSIRFKP